MSPCQIPKQLRQANLGLRLVHAPQPRSNYIATLLQPTTKLHRTAQHSSVVHSSAVLLSYVTFSDRTPLVEG